MVLQGVALTDILCLIPTAISYMTRSGFTNNNYYLITNHLSPYPTYTLPVFQCFALQDILIYHLLLSIILLARRQPLCPINTVYKKNGRYGYKSKKRFSLPDFIQQTAPYDRE